MFGQRTKAPEHKGLNTAGQEPFWMVGDFFSPQLFVFGEDTKGPEMTKRYRALLNFFGKMAYQSTEMKSVEIKLRYPIPFEKEFLVEYI